VRKAARLGNRPDDGLPVANQGDKELRLIQPMPQKSDAISRWIKSNRLIVIAGALTTVFGLVISTSNVIPVVLKTLDRPDCLTYASAYRGPFSVFKLEAGVWREYQDGAVRYEFREVHRTRDDIDLLNLTPRSNVQEWQTLIVRLPVCGGTAKITAGITQHWYDLFTVWRE
jgi:hypothetical protein